LRPPGASNSLAPALFICAIVLYSLSAHTVLHVKVRRTLYTFNLNKRYPFPKLDGGAMNKLTEFQLHSTDIFRYCLQNSDRSQKRGKPKMGNGEARAPTQLGVAGDHL